MISVIVPAYERRETLGTTLESLIAQTFTAWEAIVVDDGSTDGTAAIAAGYAARDGRIRVHRQANAGVSRARNVGIGLAREPWLFFLDADDWIVPEAFERLVAALEADADADAAYGGYVRVDDTGRELRRERPSHVTDMFPVFARTCALSVHSCLVRAALVRRAGGFDEELVTCEDWDLWQRIARLGARFTPILEDIAFYRMRLGSASGRGWRMLEDGLRVIDRGHGDDPRLSDAPPRTPLSRAARDIARTYYVCYTAAIEIAAGNDPCAMIAALGDGVSGDVDPHGVAETIFYALPVGFAVPVDGWGQFPEIVHRRCRELIDALAERTGNHWLAFGASEELDRLIAGVSSGPRPRRVGRRQLIDLDLAGDPPADMTLPDGVERVLAGVRHGNRPIADVEVAVVDGHLPARVLADAVVGPFAWDIAQAHMERHLYGQLQVELGATHARAERAGQVLHDGPLEPTRAPDQALHDRIGWTLLLQELWERPDWASDEFYDDRRRPGRREPGPRRLVRSARVVIDLADPLPTLRLYGRDRVEVAVTVAGAPLTVVACEARRGWVTAAQLRRTVLLATGYELCRVVMREAVVLAPAGVSGTLRERLAAARAAWRGGADATVVGRAERPARGRWVVVPADAARERLALARRDGDPVEGPGDVGSLLSAPTVHDGRPRLSELSLVRSIELDRLFAKPDPWHYASEYEQRKYEQTLALLPAGAECALELGCAEGAFTERLSERVGVLTAADLSPVALGRARRRCCECRNVDFAQLDVFESPLGGPYDLIVCSETLYYGTGRPALARAAAALAHALAPGGHLVTTHAHVVADQPDAPGFDWAVPFGAVTIEQELLATGLLTLEREICAAPYRVQRYVRVGRGRRRKRIRAQRLAGDHGALAAEHAERFLPRGGKVLRRPPEPLSTTTQVPILMYHRIAPGGAEATRRWRTHPRDFEAQLAHLREHDWHTLGLEQWRAACDRREPVPERSLLITFDDGYADFPDHALPLLERYGFRASLFVVTDLVGATNAWDERFGERLELMDWPALVELQARGIEIGSHSATHRALVTLTPGELARDLCRSRAVLRERLGARARTLCYPYGLHDPSVIAVAAASGFDCGLTTNEWHASLGDDLLALPRVEVRGTDTLTEFAAKLNG